MLTRQTADLAFLHVHGYMPTLDPDDMSQARLVTWQHCFGLYVMDFMVGDMVVARSGLAEQELVYQGLCDEIARVVECHLD